MLNKKDQLHSAEHLLWEVLKEKYPKLKTEALEFRNDKVRIDYRFGSKTAEIPVEEIEGRVNDFINQNLNVTIETKSREEAERICDLSLVPKNVEDIRIVNIGNISIEACAGEHIKNTSEIGMFKILETKLSGEDKLRIYATVEGKMKSKARTVSAKARIKPQILKGFRDFLPNEMRVRNFVLAKFKEVFESFGFEPLQTPSLEYAETLLGKYGEEADRLVYTFTDRGGREVGMPYDLTVPTAKVLAIYQNKITLPFKRYQVQRVWRAEKPQKGRYREILQCDVDIFGSKSPLADAEIITIIYTILKNLGFKKFTIGFSSREIVSQVLEEVAKETKQSYNEIKQIQNSILQSLDKIDNQRKDKVEAELKEKGIEIDIGKLLERLKKEVKPDSYLEKVIYLAKNLGVDEENLEFAPTLVRGLDYYTGPVFETIVEEPKIGSITGGGRYDNLVAKLGGPSIPAVGTTIGLDRICDVISELGLLKNKVKTSTQILVTIFSPETVEESVKVVSKLRTAGINAELYPNPEAKLDKQLKYADRKGIPYSIILGPEEIVQNKVMLKNMETSEQQSLPTDKIPAIIAP